MPLTCSTQSSSTLPTWSTTPSDGLTTELSAQIGRTPGRRRRRKKSPRFLYHLRSCTAASDKLQPKRRTYVDRNRASQPVRQVNVGWETNKIFVMQKKILFPRKCTPRCPGLTSAIPSSEIRHVAAETGRSRTEKTNQSINQSIKHANQSLDQSINQSNECMKFVSITGTHNSRNMPRQSFNRAIHGQRPIPRTLSFRNTTISNQKQRQHDGNRRELQRTPCHLWQIPAIKIGDTWPVKSRLRRKTYRKK